MADELTPEQRRRIAAVLKPKRGLQRISLAGIEPRRQPFLWWPYLPLGKVVIVAGAPGHGKSQFTALIASMASRGTLYPGDVLEPSRSLLLCAEDDLATTVVPRLLAVNADLRMVETINVVMEYPSGLTATGLIRLPGDAEAIHAWAREYVDARLVVLDPVASFFDREHNTLFNQDIRDALAPLVAIAEGYGITIVVILHLNKSESKDFANRIAESHGFQALARSVMAIGPDPDDPQRERGAKKILAVTKANLVKPGTYSMRCEIRSVVLPGYAEPIETSELALLGKCDVSADDLLMGAGERETRMEAAEWLADFMDGGWRKVADVRKAATSDGFSWRTIQRIRKDSGYQREKEGDTPHGVWWMGAPNAGPRARDVHLGTGGVAPLDQGDQSNGLGNVDGLGDVGGVGGSKDARPPVPSDESRARAREDKPLDDPGFDLDEYRKWEQRKLGERDDEDDDG